MARQRWMQIFAKWHIWLGWLVGVPMLMWTVTGLVMVAKPIDEVRGADLRRDLPVQALPPDTNIAVSLPSASTKPVKSVTTQVERGETVTRIAYADGSSERFRPDGSPMGPLSDVEARLIVAEGIRGGDHIAGVEHFAPDAVPLDFRRPLDVWQVSLEDGTHVYVGAQSGQIEAVRTRWWRFYDTMWGLHIMDLQTRENAHNPVIIAFAVLAMLGALLGCVLMFRRRKARAVTQP